MFPSGPEDVDFLPPRKAFKEFQSSVMQLGSAESLICRRQCLANAMADHPSEIPAPAQSLAIPSPFPPVFVCRNQDGMPPFVPRRRRSDLVPPEARESQRQPPGQG